MDKQGGAWLAAVTDGMPSEFVALVGALVEASPLEADVSKYTTAATVAADLVQLRRLALRATAGTIGADEVRGHASISNSLRKGLEKLGLYTVPDETSEHIAQLMANLGNA